MVGLLDNKQNTPPAEVDKFFDAGIAYMQSGEYAFAYYCFDRTGKTDIQTLYNKALRCHYIGWLSECRILLKEMERLFPSGIDGRLRELPETFVRWEKERTSALCPMPHEAPLPVAAIQMLLLKAENAYGMQLYGEVRNVAACLGGEYRRIDELLKTIDDDHV